VADVIKGLTAQGNCGESGTSFRRHHIPSIPTVAPYKTIATSWSCDVDLKKIHPGRRNKLSSPPLAKWAGRVQSSYAACPPPARNSSLNYDHVGRAVSNSAADLRRHHRYGDTGPDAAFSFPGFDLTALLVRGPVFAFLLLHECGRTRPDLASFRPGRRKGFRSAWDCLPDCDSPFIVVERTWQRFFRYHNRFWPQAFWSRRCRDSARLPGQSRTATRRKKSGQTRVNVDKSSDNIWFVSVGHARTKFLRPRSSYRPRARKTFEKDPAIADPPKLAKHEAA